MFGELFGSDSKDTKYYFIGKIETYFENINHILDQSLRKTCYERLKREFVCVLN